MAHDSDTLESNMPSKGLYSDWRNYEFIMQQGRKAADNYMRRVGHKRWGKEEWSVALRAINYLMEPCDITTEDEDRSWLTADMVKAVATLLYGE
jgi:hypothetical protein